MKILTCEETRSLEERAVRSGCSYDDLMEQAGSAVAGYIRSHYDITDKEIVVLCGKGNNGGDGFVIAERLCDLCDAMTVILVDGLPVTDLAKRKLANLRTAPVQVLQLSDGTEPVLEKLRTASIVVDAIYGIGFHGEIRSELLPIFRAVNEGAGAVVSVDIPSGLQGDSNQLHGAHLCADATVTFFTYKPVHLFAPAKFACGTVQVCPLNVGKNCIAQQHSTAFVTDSEQIRQVLKPRNPESHKGTYGRLLLLCGSEGMAGAAVLAASAAVRSGTGLVEVALPREIYPIVAANVIEPVYTIYDTAQPEKACKKLLAQLEKATACVIGCGLGQSVLAQQLVLSVLTHAKVPVVLDADGINLVSKHKDVWKTVSAPVILTPHIGEMARLLGIRKEEVLENPLQCARAVAEQPNRTVVLKGHNTLTLHSFDGVLHTAYNNTGNAGMAKGGSGDVLAGLIGGLCAQGIEPFPAAYTGVYLHGLAGDRAASRYSQHGMLPTHMAQQLSELFSDYE